MVPQNLELLFEHKGYEYYVLEEKGFSNKQLANENHLYEDFVINGIEYSSGFKNIYTQNLYADNKISQIWIFRDDNPIGLCLGIHHDVPVKVPSEKSELTAEVLGYIQLYIQEEHRGQGLASEAIPLLEGMLKKKAKYPPAFIMQDDALPFGKFLKDGCAVPIKTGYGFNPLNKKKLETFFKNIMEDEARLTKYKEKYSGFAEEYNTLVEKEKSENKIALKKKAI